VNAPWPAIDWGPKRWATGENVCARQQAGTAYPGDENLNYKLNPGEAWAETYRTLADRKANVAFSWETVDPSFVPADAALAAAEQDVLQPWTSGASTVATGRFVKKGRLVWTLPIRPPLDGTLQLTLNPPRGRSSHASPPGARSAASRSRLRSRSSSPLRPELRQAGHHVRIPQDRAPDVRLEP
jgi:hypothetical protein